MYTDIDIDTDISIGSDTHIEYISSHHIYIYIYISQSVNGPFALLPRTPPQPVGLKPPGLQGERIPQGPRAQGRGT